MSTARPAPIATPPADARFALVAARFNDHLVSQLIDGCRGRLIELGVEESALTLHRVPGAFELPTAAKWLAESGHFAAVVCLGAVVRGDTPHFDFVAGECARGCQSVSLSTGVPVIFGVLTTNTEQQALDRLGGLHGHAGVAAAEAAAEMAALAAPVHRPPRQSPL